MFLEYGAGNSVLGTIVLLDGHTNHGEEIQVL